MDSKEKVACIVFKKAQMALNRLLKSLLIPFVLRNDLGLRWFLLHLLIIFKNGFQLLRNDNYSKNNYFVTSLLLVYLNHLYAMSQANQRYNRLSNEEVPGFLRCIWNLYTTGLTLTFQFETFETWVWCL